MNTILKLLLNNLLIPKVEKLVKTTSNQFDDKFLSLLKELIKHYL